MAKKFPPINYTSREFNSIRDDLIEYAKRYYPDTFKDFNEASFGALMIDQVAYIGDILSFYLDYQANESFISTANEYDNIVKLARQVGYKMTPRGAASGIATFFILVPANTNGIGPDTKYLPVLKAGTRLASVAGGKYTLNEPVNFGAPENEVVVASADSNNTPTYYAVRARGTVTSGELQQEEITIGNFQKFLTIPLTTPAITEIISVVDSQGHAYFEVDHLSQNTVYIPITNQKSDRNNANSILVPLVVPRRFVVEKERDAVLLQFGHGSDSELSTSSIIDPTDVMMDLHGRSHVTDRSFDPTKLLSTDKFGVAPENTILTVTFRANPPDTANAAVNSITSVVAPSFDFSDRDTLSEATISDVIGSLEVTNEEPIIGDFGMPEPEELKARIKSHMSAQNRAVTEKDYESLIYNMPAQFGKIKRCRILQDPDSFRRNLNIHVVSQNSDGTLIKTPQTAKENLKIWLGRNKMINDTIAILDARIANVGINFEVIGDSNFGKFEVLDSCYQRLREVYDTRTLQIGESLDIAVIYKILNDVPGVIDTVDVSIVGKTGGGYSDVFFDVDNNLSGDGRTLFTPEDFILEIKNPSKDITGSIR